MRHIHRIMHVHVKVPRHAPFFMFPQPSRRPVHHLPLAHLPPRPQRHVRHPSRRVVRKHIHLDGDVRVREHRALDLVLDAVISAGGVEGVDVRAFPSRRLLVARPVIHRERRGRDGVATFAVGDARGRGGEKATRRRVVVVVVVIIIFIFSVIGGGVIRLGPTRAIVVVLARGRANVRARLARARELGDAMDVDVVVDVVAHGWIFGRRRVAPAESSAREDVAEGGRARERERRATRDESIGVRERATRTARTTAARGRRGDGDRARWCFALGRMDRRARRS